MKVTKAIEVILHLNRWSSNYLSADEMDALKLSLEALKRHRNRDYLAYNELHELLPGESPEEE